MSKVVITSQDLADAMCGPFEMIEHWPGQDPTDKQQAGLIFKLDWTTRDDVIFNLNRYTALFCGEKVEADGKEKLMYDNTDLYQVLIGLPLKSNASVPVASGQPNKIVLDLDGTTRLQIIKTLIVNQSLVVDGNAASEEDRSNMVKQNNELVVKLVNLPVSANAGFAKEPAANGQTGLVKRSEVANEIARLKKMINDQSAKNLELTKLYNAQTTKTADLNRMLQEQSAKNSLLMNDQTMKMNSSGKGLEQLDNIVKTAAKASDLKDVISLLAGRVDLGLNRKTATFEFVLNDVDGVFLPPRRSRKSEYFFANQLAWHLQVVSDESSVGLGDKVLSIYLYAEDYSGAKGNYWGEATFEVTVLHPSRPNQDLSRKITSEFGPTKSNKGWFGFISRKSLRDDGYVEQNKTRIQVHLEMNKPKY